MSLDRALALVEQLSRLKRLATGSPCAAFPTNKVASAAVTFEDLATAVYKWYWEQLRGDVNYMSSCASHAQRSVLSNFTQILSDQRHVDQHADYERAANAYQWRAELQGAPSDGHPSHNPLSVALLGELCVALECLCTIAADIGRDNSKRVAWSQIAATSPEEEIRAVYRNIGRHPPLPVVSHAVRQFRSHPDLRRAATPAARAQLAEAVVVGSSFGPLVVAYDEIVDEFGLIGDPRAASLLLLAHAAQSAGVQRRSLIPVLKNAWAAIQGS